MSDIRNKRTWKSVGEHFNLRGHSKEDLTIMIIDQDKFEILRRERDWINKLRTKVPDGINRR